MSLHALGSAVGLVFVVFFATVTAQDEIELTTVVGCLKQEDSQLPWVLERATAGTETETAFTNREELDRSSREELGTLQYRPLGVGEFGIESHIGHKLQIKGLKLRFDGEWRLNVTSLQQLLSSCE